MTFVIRSMSTTDYSPAYRSGNAIVPAQQPKPYHVYLMPVGQRARAYWSSLFHAMRFGTEAEAQDEIDRCNLTGCDIAPEDHTLIGFPDYWVRRREAQS